MCSRCWDKWVLKTVQGLEEETSRKEESVLHGVALWRSQGHELQSHDSQAVSSTLLSMDAEYNYFSLYSALMWVYLLDLNNEELNIKAGIHYQQSKEFKLSHVQLPTNLTENSKDGFKKRRNTWWWRWGDSFLLCRFLKSSLIYFHNAHANKKSFP